MATKHEEFKVYYFSFTDEELATIITALRCHGEDKFADEIADQVYDDEPEPDWREVDGATQALESLAMAAVEAERAVNSLNRTTGGAFGKDAW